MSAVFATPRRVQQARKTASIASGHVAISSRKVRDNNDKSTTKRNRKGFHQPLLPPFKMP